MMEMFRRAHAHKGASFVEIYQNCNVFNDGAFEQITGKDHRADMLIPLVHGEPIRFGPEGEHRRGHGPGRLGRGGRGGRRRRGRAAGPRRAQGEPRARLPAQPAVAGALRADADRRLPGRRARARVRRSRWPTRSPRPPSAGARATSPPCCGPARPGRSSRPARPSGRPPAVAHRHGHLRRPAPGHQRRWAQPAAHGRPPGHGGLARLRRRRRPTCRAGTWSSPVPGLAGKAGADLGAGIRDRAGPGPCR